MKHLKHLITIVLCLCMVLSLLPGTALAAGPAVNYLDITMDDSGNPTDCTYKGSTDTDTEGILIEDGTYTLAGDYAGIIVVSGAAVTFAADLDLSRLGDTIFIFGSGSLITNNLTVTKGSYTTAYSGLDGDALLEAVAAVKTANATYSYEFTGDYTRNETLDAYTVSVNSGTLTVSGEGYALSVAKSLSVSGALNAAVGQTLKFGANAEVDGLELYFSGGKYSSLPATHDALFFIYGSTPDSEPPVNGWVCDTELPIYTITSNLTGSGSVSSPNFSPYESGIVPNGASVSYAFTANTGYVIDTMTVDGVAVTAAANQKSYTYEFENVTADHTISVSFKENPLITPVAAIQARHWAYNDGSGTAEERKARVKAAFVTELWDMLIHEYPELFGDESGKTNETVLADMVNVGTLKNDGSITGLSTYYPYTVTFAGRTVTGSLYVLGAANKFVVRTTVGGTDTFTVMTAQSGDAALVMDYDAGGIEVFGNGAAAVGSKGKTDTSAAFHVTDERVDGSAVNCTLVVYKPTFEGLKFARSGDGGTAAAWDFGSYPFASLAATSEEAPAVFETFFGDSSVSFGIPADVGITDISGVISTLPEGAVTITVTNNFCTVNFTSNFYDKVPLKTTYADRDGTSKTGYLLIKRVGIDIQGYREAGDASGNNLTLLHGTQNSTTYKNFYNTNERGVFATFYYPTGTSANQVQLVATYTWRDGSVTRQTISAHDPVAADGSLVASDDFQLYAGTAAGLPVKIEVTAVKTESSTTSFAGASLGSGAGVVWVCPESLRS